MSLNVFLKKLSDLNVVICRCFFFLVDFLMKIDDEDGMKMRKKMKERDEDGKTNGM